MKDITIILLLLFGLCTVAGGQEIFEYEDAEKTIISGLTESGRSSSTTTLIIPSGVRAVRANALSGACATALVVNASSISFGEQSGSGVSEGQFVQINFSNATDGVSMASVISGLGSLFSEEGIIEIEGLGGCGGSINLSSVLRGKGGVRVIMPASLVRDYNKEDFNFGEYSGEELDYDCAQVYGRFVLSTDVGTFCGSAKFRDSDDGSNFLFYVPTGVTSAGGDKQVHVQRVSHIETGQGVIIHNELNTAGEADLPRYNGELSYEDLSRYGSSMLVGTLAPTPLSETDGDKTNMILYNGLFYKTSGGTLGANKAYLQIPTVDLPASGKMSMYVEEESESTLVAHPYSGVGSVFSGAYTLSGLRVAGDYRGIVIKDNKKIKR